MARQSRYAPAATVEGENRQALRCPALSRYAGHGETSSPKEVTHREGAHLNHPQAFKTLPLAQPAKVTRRAIFLWLRWLLPTSAASAKPRRKSDR
jgi:hypothetical protein